MAPSAATCISCGRKFAENRELAAVPDASKVAFDPSHRRVWRICGYCGEWNLLGAEATAVALPEIEARFAASSPGSASALAFAPARISSRLELLRVGQADVIGPDDGSAARLRTEVARRTKGWRWFVVVLVVAFLVWCAFSLWVTHGSLRPAPMLLLLFSSVSLMQHAVSKVRRSKAANPDSLLVSCGAFLLGLGLTFATHQQDQLRYFAVGLIGTAPLLFAVEVARSRVGIVRVALANGTTLRLSETDMPRVTISWTSGDTDLSLHDLPRDRSLSGPDVAVAFRRIYPWSLKRGLVHLAVTMTAVTENAYNLLRTLGGLGGLLRALEGFRRDNDGRVLITRLPIIYLVALDLALSDRPSRTTGADDLHQRGLDAAEIASEAEALDASHRPTHS